jgi:hypothetical protein
MNKLVAFPIGVLAVLCMMAVAIGVSMPADPGTTVGNNSEAATFTWDISNLQIILAGALVVVAVAIAAGFGIFGSGFSDTSQVIIFKAGIIIGLYSLLALGAWDFTHSFGTMGDIALAMLSIMFVVGFALDFSGGK